MRKEAIKFAPFHPFQQTLVSDWLRDSSSHFRGHKFWRQADRRLTALKETSERARHVGCQSSFLSTSSIKCFFLEHWFITGLFSLLSVSEAEKKVLSTFCTSKLEWGRQLSAARRIHQHAVMCLFWGSSFPLWPTPSNSGCYRVLNNESGSIL
jgi:hypothetical protein